jgi:regulator of replication initiation timing
MEAPYYNAISLLHVINDTRIWPTFFYRSSDDIKEQILIGSLAKDTNPNRFILNDNNLIGIGIDSTVNVVTYKSKTMQDVLTEIAGLLVLTSILTFFLASFNEWMFDRKIKRETNDEFREIFTY